LKIHFSGWSNKYDEWIDTEISPHRLVKQWQRGEPVRLFNRLDVKDTVNKWMEAHVVEINKHYIKIHYKGWAAKFDEYLPADKEEFK
jgi:hypothetical protein